MRFFFAKVEKFRTLVKERGDELRKLSYGELAALAAVPTEHFSVETRPAKISIIVLPQADKTLKVVVQGFMKVCFPFGEHVALDGFYKHVDGSVTPMRDYEFYEFD